MVKLSALLIALLIGTLASVPIQAKTKSGGSSHSSAGRSHGKSSKHKAGKHRSASGSRSQRKS